VACCLLRAIARNRSAGANVRYCKPVNYAYSTIRHIGFNEVAECKLNQKEQINRNFAGFRVSAMQDVTDMGDEYADEPIAPNGMVKFSSLL
jgi:hypothetical protein